MSKPYGLMADVHADDWTSFGGQDEQGRSIRLMNILREMDRCCQEVIDAGGNTVVIAGDLFHKRGSIRPSVFNPVRDLINAWVEQGIEFVGIAGNHDVEGKTVTPLGSTMNMLNGDKVSFMHTICLCDDLPILLVPYVGNGRATMTELGRLVAKLGDSARAELDIIIHCGIDGTLKGVPDHGFSADALAKLGFKRVFAGDYHAHKDFGNGVYSIGALTHQTWGDVGTQAGFLLVYPDRVDFRAAHAPEFVDLTGEEDPEDVALIVDGHYVRAKIKQATAAQVEGWRRELMEMGAKGVIILQQPDTAATKREGASTKSLLRLDESVAAYVTERGMSSGVATLCADILKGIIS